jgi:hypothetical protein
MPYLVLSLSHHQLIQLALNAKLELSVQSLDLLFLHAQDLSVALLESMLYLVL